MVVGGAGEERRESKERGRIEELKGKNEGKFLRYEALNTWVVE